MQLPELLQLFESSSAVKLLRANNAPFVLAFFAAQFKSQSRLSMPHGQLKAALESFQDELHESFPTVLRDRAENYLTEWSSLETGWLHRLVELSHTEPVYQLTPQTEAVLSFVEMELLDNASFVGTECRLQVIVDLLDDVASSASSDPVQRIAKLKGQRDRIEAQIVAIEAGEVPLHSDETRIRERFRFATSLLSQLQSDFRAVEERFKQLARQVHHRHAEGVDSRGAILEFALDQEDQLKESDQGKSFLEFVRLVHSPERQERLASLIRELTNLKEIQSDSVGIAKLQGMLPMLIAEAEKILRTTQRLSQTLRRLLDARTSRQRQQLSMVLREVQSLASQSAGNPATVEVQIAIDVDLEIQSPVERAFWSPAPTFESVVMHANESDDELRLQTLHQLAGLNRLDWSAMRSRIRQTLKHRERASLADLLQAFPARSGPIEVLGYVQIAHDDGHHIDSSCTEELMIEDTEGKPRVFQIPRIEFVSRHDST